MTPQLSPDELFIVKRMQEDPREAAAMLLLDTCKRHGIDNIVVEQRSPAYVLGRIRAGVLEQVTVGLLEEAGVAERLHAEGLPHHGFDMCFGGQRHRIDLQRLVGQHVTVYGQTEVTRDLMHHRAAIGRASIYEAQDVAVHGFDGAHPRVSYRHAGAAHEIQADFIVGCDGFHGVCRASVPTDALRTFEKLYPFGWLGVLADVPPVADELIYGHTERGFMLASTRSATRSRYYVQCSLEDKVENWSDQAFWDEFRRRLPAEDAARLVTGPSIEKSIAPLRSFVAEPLRFGTLFLAGDAAHIVPPTGAKGLNLAAGDVGLLARALAEFYAGHRSGIDTYSQRALARVWKAERFSWWFTSLMHQFPEGGGFGARMQRAELDYLFTSESAQRVVAENYVGLPLQD